MDSRSRCGLSCLPQRPAKVQGNEKNIRNRLWVRSATIRSYGKRYLLGRSQPALQADVLKKDAAGSDENIRNSRATIGGATMIEFDLVIRSNYGPDGGSGPSDAGHSAGRTFALLGPNGAGKTPQTIRFAGGPVPTRLGQVRVCGVIVSQAARGQQPFGYVPDEQYLYEKNSPAARAWNSLREMHGLDRATTRELNCPRVGTFQLRGFLDNLTETYWPVCGRRAVSWP